MGEEFARSEELDWAPKFCKTFAVLYKGSSTGCLLCKTLRRTFVENPKGSAEFLGGGETPNPCFELSGLAAGDSAISKIAWRP